MRASLKAINEADNFEEKIFNSTEGSVFRGPSALNHQSDNHKIVNNAAENQIQANKFFNNLADLIKDGIGQNWSSDKELNTTFLKLIEKYTTLSGASNVSNQSNLQIISDGLYDKKCVDFTENFSGNFPFEELLEKFFAKEQQIYKNFEVFEVERYADYDHDDASLYDIKYNRKYSNNPQEKKTFDIIIDGSNLYYLLSRVPKIKVSKNDVYQVRNDKKKRRNQNGNQNGNQSEDRDNNTRTISTQDQANIEAHEKLKMLFSSFLKSQYLHGLAHYEKSEVLYRPLKVCILSNNMEALNYLEEYFSDLRNSFSSNDFLDSLNSRQMVERDSNESAESMSDSNSLESDIDLHRNHLSIPPSELLDISNCLLPNLNEDKECIAMSLRHRAILLSNDMFLDISEEIKNSDGDSMGESGKYSDLFNYWRFHCHYGISRVLYGDKSAVNFKGILQRFNFIDSVYRKGELNYWCGFFEG